MRYLHLLAAAFFLVSCNAIDAAEEQPYNHIYARHRYLHTDRPITGQAVKDSYLIVLKKGTSREVFAAATGVNAGALAKAEKRFSIGTFNGYAGKYDKKTIQKLRLAPEVAYIEPNHIVTTSAIVNRATPNWNLHRISNITPLTNTSAFFNYRTSSYYQSKNCSSDVYIIDTGIHLSHVEFEGRATFGANTIGGSNGDGNGHGTHVAGLIAGKTFGVEPKANLIAVKALDDEGYGSFASVIEGVSWVVKEVQRRKRQGVSILNMSLIGNSNRAMNDAVEAAFRAGIVITVASGNYGELAVNFSPASAHEALTVAATDILDVQTEWSNYGIVVDFQAPGNRIRSAWIDSDSNKNNNSAVLSGTSMASPHVAGLVSYIMCTEEIRIPRIIRERLRKYAIPGVVKGAGNTTPNFLAYNGIDESESDA
ncbi:peptidase S8/S53 domain-containing protein [Peziza echinospora]|nr:peptidase S8/S53 domain-containing protein [Peziza echinospora]